MSKLTLPFVKSWRVAVVVVSLLACVPAQSIAAEAAESAAPAAIEFVRNAAQSFSSQREMAEAVQGRSKDPAVREFAGRVLQASEQAQRALTQLAEEQKIDLITREPTPSTPSAPVATSGATLDRTYSLEAAQELAKLDRLFAEARNSAKIPASLKQFVSQHAATIAQLRKQADSLAQAQAAQGSSRGSSTAQPPSGK